VEAGFLTPTHFSFSDGKINLNCYILLRDFNFVCFEQILFLLNEDSRGLKLIDLVTSQQLPWAMDCFL
jgi:hypothetical protein